MAYRKDAFTMPYELTGAPGEVLSVTQWPISPLRFNRIRLGQVPDGATDCVIHFDRIKTGGKHNARRVYYDGRLFVHWHKARFGRVYISGALLWEVLECVSYVYTLDDGDDVKKKVYAARKTC